jgi:hypothetical protein
MFWGKLSLAVNIAILLVVEHILDRTLKVLCDPKHYLAARLEFSLLQLRNVGLTDLNLSCQVRLGNALPAVSLFSPLFYAV